MTIGATRPMPAVRASKPKETPNRSTAIPIGTARRAPSRSRVVIELHHRHLPLGGEGGVAARERDGGALCPDRFDREPLLGLGEKDAHLCEERSRRRSSVFEVVDSLESREYGAGFVHATDGTREHRACWCRSRAERTASAGSRARGHEGAADRPTGPRTETEQRLVEAGDETSAILVDHSLDERTPDGIGRVRARSLACRKGAQLVE